MSALLLCTLEDRAPVASLIPGGTVMLTGGTLTYSGTAGNDHVLIRYENGLIAVRDQSGLLGTFSPGAVSTIAVSAGAGDDLVNFASNITQAAVLDGGTGKNLLEAGGGPTRIIGSESTTKLVGGSGTNTLVGGTGNELFVGGSGTTSVVPGGGADKVVRVTTADPVALTPTTRVAVNNPAPTPTGSGPQPVLTTSEVNTLLRRAAAASSSNDAIIAITDRNGRILGVRTEAGVAPQITSNPALLVFAIDGAVSLARTGAFFGNNQAPLTSRTIRSLSQSTITQREVESNPNIPDVTSTQRGPGYVAPVGTGAHFPPGVPNTPEVDLFGIEHTNRDGSTAPGADGVLGTADDIPLTGRFDINPAFVPAGQTLFAPDSYGVVTGLLPSAQNRGIATLPGGIPLFKNGAVVGGIGVFFPGKTGYATEENSNLSANFDPTKPDRSLEAEFIAFAAAGGSAGEPFNLPIGAINGVPALPGFTEPGGRIDLVGVTLDVFGPGGFEGPKKLNDLGQLLGVGNPDSGVNRQVTTTAAVTLLPGLPVPTGWLVTPHDGVGITAAEVSRIIQQGIAQANLTRAAIRLPASSGVRMVFAVTDRTGDVVGLYRQPDATVFSIDVAVAKARNTAYYADPTKLQTTDQVPGVPRGTAFSNRTIRFLSLPRFPSSADGTAPGPFSILNDGGSNLLTGLQQDQRLPASAFQSVYGHDSFFPGTNFHDPTNLDHQNGIVFFPGSAPLYRAGAGLIGGFGVSGDGVDQDDVVTTGGQVGFTPVQALRADQTFFKGVRLPYQKYDRNPETF
jgi:uncharacterized protein GlcG (DUF336 family)